ncbi:hypothetical protein [Bosea sp. CS1GBMeth4]|uniref:hypothetical protein n=1 Tax=Bosea sp. CS1GBMeth4 TaxID=1892849 RepID=UPI0016442B24|nr:hypothetical protein [Bosea sp. CS1GBMeth4]
MSEEEEGKSQDLGFPWPKLGDKAFSSAARPIDNVVINTSGHGKTWRMTDGYKRAADHLVKLANANWHEREHLVYPILFNYRHFIELSLKSLIDEFGPEVGVPANWKTHDLIVLWEALKRIYEIYGIVERNDEDTAVESVIKEFAVIDPGSFSFRYPRDTKGNPVSLPQSEVDLAEMANVMEALEVYFSGCEGYLDHIQNSRP